MKVKTNHVPEDCDYLTNGKIYTVLLDPRYTNGKAGHCTDDLGEIIFINISCSNHLNGKPWEIIGEEDD
jgi:hypothetical protein